MECTYDQTEAESITTMDTAGEGNARRSSSHHPNTAGLGKRRAPTPNETSLCSCHHRREESLRTSTEEHLSQGFATVEGYGSCACHTVVSPTLSRQVHQAREHDTTTTEVSPNSVTKTTRTWQGAPQQLNHVIRHCMSVTYKSRPRGCKGKERSLDFFGRTRLRRSPNNSDAREEVSWVWGQQQHRTNTSHNTSQQPRKASPHNRHCNDTSSSRFHVDTLKNASLGIAAQHTASVFLSKSAARVDDCLIPSAALVKEAAKHACAAAWVNDTQQRARLQVCLERVGPATDGQQTAHIRSLQNRVEGR